MKQEYRGISIANIDSKVRQLKISMNPKKLYELKEMRSKRSIDISTRFHGHITFMARELQLNRQYVYYMVLLKAVEINADGGSPYPYTIVPQNVINEQTLKLEVRDVVIPERTSERTNKEMITACFACQLFWYESGGEGCLPEKYDEYGVPL